MNAWLSVALDFVRSSNFAAIFADAALKSFVVLTIAGVVSLLWRRASAAARHWMWFLAVASLLCLPLVSLALPSTHRRLWSVSSGIESGNRISLAFELAPTGKTAAEGNTIQALAKTGDDSAPALSQSEQSRIALRFDAGWLVGALIGRIRLYRISKRSIPVQDEVWSQQLREICDSIGLRRLVRLMKCTENVMPLTWGWFRPIVLLPEGSDQWPAERRRIVLSHELAHARRWDCLTQSIATITCALYWFNPLVWFAARRMRIERERACDDLVLNGGCKPSVYAGHLVEIAGAFRLARKVTAIAMARPTGLERRVELILDSHRSRLGVARITSVLLVLGILGIALLLGVAATTTGAAAGPWSLKNSSAWDQLRVFVTEKEAQTLAASEPEGKEVLPEYKAMFAAAANGDWQSISNIWEDLRSRAPQYEGKGPKDLRLHGTGWQAVLEIWGAFGNIAMGGENLVAIGEDAVESIEPGSIYFGGTDPGRCVITALQKSQVNGDPFFTLTQNALADGSYLAYLRRMYGEKMYIPTDDDSQRCFNEYLSDAEKRMNENKLKPGEDVKTVDGKVQVRGQVAVMAINGLLSKLIFDKNPDREFYVEESFPLDWMYPHLLPNGPIMKINRKPLTELPTDAIQHDHDYWVGAVRPMIGGWLDYDTSLEKIRAFAEKAYPRPPKPSIYIGDDSATKWAAKLRSSIAGVYEWRVDHADNNTEKSRMSKEADFAFRQAFALCPYSPEAVFRYVNFLKSQGRISDALLVAETAEKLDPDDGTMKDLIQSLKNMSK